MEIENTQLQRKERLSPSHPLLHERPDDNFRRPHKLNIIIQSTPPNEDIQAHHFQNPDDQSQNIFVNDSDKFKNFTVGKNSYSRGLHVWQLESPTLRCIYVGVATNDAPLDSHKLIGYDQDSYGWNIFLNSCFHNWPLFAEWAYPVGVEGNGTFEVRDKLYCILDMDEGTLAFGTDEQYFGVAFRGLKGKTVFPIVSTCWDEFGFTMKYLGGMNLSDEPSRCSCKGCTRLVISWYCKDCSAECVIDHDEKGSGDGGEMKEKEEDGQGKNQSDEHSDATDFDAKSTRGAVDCEADHDEKGSGDGGGMKEEDGQGKNHSDEQSDATDTDAKPNCGAAGHDEKGSGDGGEMQKEEEEGEKMEVKVYEEEEVKQTGCCCAMVKKAWNRLCRWTIRMYARSQELYHI